MVHDSDSCFCAVSHIILVGFEPFEAPPIGHPPLSVLDIRCPVVGVRPVENPPEARAPVGLIDKGLHVVEDPSLPAGAGGRVGGVFWPGACPVEDNRVGQLVHAPVHGERARATAAAVMVTCFDNLVPVLLVKFAPE